MTGYEFHAKVNVQIPDSVWQYNGEVTLVGPRREVEEDGTVKMMQGVGRIGRLLPFKTGADSEEKPLQVAAPPAIFGRFNAISRDAIHVERTGSEVLQLNGDDLSCEILKVTYTPSTYENTHPEEVTYWINAARHLVLGLLALLGVAGYEWPVIAPARLLFTLTQGDLDATASLLRHPAGFLLIVVGAALMFAAGSTVFERRDFSLKSD
jgi:hypothetical protein